MYNKTELDKLRDDIKEQIVDPEIKKLEESLTLLQFIHSSVATTEPSLTSTKLTLKSIQSSTEHEKTQLKNLMHQVQRGLFRTQ